MKTHTIILFTKSLLLIFTLGFCTTLTAQMAKPVRVAAIVKTEHDDPKGGNAEVVKKHLEIDISGGANFLGDVKVTCTFFADDLSAGKVVNLKSNDLKTELVAGKSTRLISPEVSFNFTPQHSEKSGSGRRAKYKRIEATGNRYHGWAVQVFRGSDFVGEAYSNNDIKKLLPQ